MGKTINSIKLTNKLTLSECTDGFWLWDDTRKMNLSMKAKTPQDAFVECISYYQERLSEIEAKYGELSEKVNSFVSQFTEEEDQKTFK